MFSFDHFNFNVRDLDRSLAFYREALGLFAVRETEGQNGLGPYKIVFLSDGASDFRLELTWLAAHALHEKLGCICFENPDMGIYFITDPDGYWIEIVPEKK